MEYKKLDTIKNGIECLTGMSTIAYIKSAEISNQFVSGNIPDMIYPITNYAAYRVLVSERPSLPFAIGTAGIGTLAEFAQYAGLYPGTFDIKDIPLYFIGAGIAYGFDKLTFTNKTTTLDERVG